MRPQILFPLFAPVSSLKGVGAKSAPLLAKVAGPLVRDLVFLSPQNVVERPRLALGLAPIGEIGTFHVRIEGHFPPNRRGGPYQIRAGDGTGVVLLSWFRVHGTSFEALHPLGSLRVVSGRLELYRGELTLAHPDYFFDASREAEIPRLEPVYPATEGLTSRQIRRLALEALTHAPALEEWLDLKRPERADWPDWRSALERLHHPTHPGVPSLRDPARMRLAYDELLAHQLALMRRKVSVGVEPATAIAPGSFAAAAKAALSFTLTGAQERCLAEIRGDLGRGRRMSRILQGDVGSGKTVVAMLAMADVAGAGLQAALMAPTDILARQHFETMARALAAAGASPLLLTGRDKGAVRREKLEKIASGAAAVVVGTHALFQDDVQFAALGLAVIDEQHRFGVSERRRLQDKGQAVHTLALSATPIPRTLELTLFGDLDVSRLDEKPKGRRPAVTTAAPTTRVPEVTRRLAAALDGGAQAFWICPLVTESELVDATAAEARAAALRSLLGAQVGLVHGKMPASEKDRVMAAFVDGSIGLLVATTVVEVGVDVPRASIMVIEHAERFGLAQLHQLRGRVGRGGGESACLLLYDPPLSASARQRLDVLRRTDDGFLIAEKDLELRGGGDLMGLRQSGLPDYRFADPLAHRDLLLAAHQEARYLLSRPPSLDPKRAAALSVLEALYDWSGRSGWTSAG
jgi:ATP-dependent DNA helicase RecG